MHEQMKDSLCVSKQTFLACYIAFHLSPHLYAWRNWTKLVKQEQSSASRTCFIIEKLVWFLSLTWKISIIYSLFQSHVVAKNTVKAKNEDVATFKKSLANKLLLLFKV